MMNSEVASMKELVLSLLLLEAQTRECDLTFGNLLRMSDSKDTVKPELRLDECLRRMISLCQSVEHETESNLAMSCVKNMVYSLKEKASKGIDTPIKEKHTSSSKVFTMKKMITCISDESICDIAYSNEIQVDSLRRNRVRISQSARNFLERAFYAQNRPNSKDRELIARKCGLSKTQVRVWFTNKRMRCKRSRIRP